MPTKLPFPSKNTLLRDAADELENFRVLKIQELANDLITQRVVPAGVRHREALKIMDLVEALWTAQVAMSRQSAEDKAGETFGGCPICNGSLKSHHQMDEAKGYMNTQHMLKTAEAHINGAEEAFGKEWNDAKGEVVVKREVVVGERKSHDGTYVGTPEFKPPQFIPEGPELNFYYRDPRPPGESVLIEHQFPTSYADR